MFGALLSRLFPKKDDKSGDGAESKKKRTFKRHDTDRCVALIRGQNFRVANWSMGGMEVLADDTVFLPDQPISFTLKFKLDSGDLAIVHNGVIIRSHGGKTSVRFEPLTQLVKNGLQKVVDDDTKRSVAAKDAARKK